MPDITRIPRSLEGDGLMGMPMRTRVRITIPRDAPLGAGVILVAVTVDAGNGRDRQSSIVSETIVDFDDHAGLARAIRDAFNARA